MTVFEKVRKLVADKLSVSLEEVTLESSLVDDLGADSIDSVELVMDIEDEYNIELTDEELQSLKTVNDIVKFIESLAK